MSQSDGSIEVKGMILSAANLSEYDKRLVILTKERGRITAFAKGARRAAGNMNARTQPFGTGTFRLLPTRDAYSLRECEIDDYFDGIANDMVCMAYGSYFLELASFLSSEDGDATDLLNLLYLSVKALMKGRLPYRDIRAAFELRAVTGSGEFAAPGVCTDFNPGNTDCLCRNRENGENNLLEEGFYVARTGGIYCSACAKKRFPLIFAGTGPFGGLPMDTIPLNRRELDVLRIITAAPLGKLYPGLYGMEGTEEAFVRIRDLSGVHLAKFVGGHFKSLDVLTAIEES